MMLTIGRPQNKDPNLQRPKHANVNRPGGSIARGVGGEARKLVPGSVRLSTVVPFFDVLYSLSQG